MVEFSVEETPGILPLDLLGKRMIENEKVKDFNERFMSLLNGIPIKPVETFRLNIMFLLYNQTFLCLLKLKEI